MWGKWMIRLPITRKKPDTRYPLRYRWKKTVVRVKTEPQSTRKYITDVGEKKKIPARHCKRLSFICVNLKQPSSLGWLIIRHRVFVRCGTVWWNSHCPDHKIMYHMSAHTRKHDVNIRDKRIRLRTTRKTLRAFRYPAPTFSLSV